MSVLSCVLQYISGLGLIFVGVFYSKTTEIASDI